MAEGRVEGPMVNPPSKNYLWTEIFRSFQVALDPRKLLLAAAGILVMSLGWYLLSTIFWYEKPDDKAKEYADEKTIQNILGDKKPDDTDYSTEEYLADGQRRYQADLRQWVVLNQLAGKDGGKLRTMPWNEFRGENPFLFATRITNLPSAKWGEEIQHYLTAQVPVLTEPLQKLILPILKFIDPNASFLTRIYLLLCLIWSVAVWAFFGGVITRIAAVNFGGKDRVTLKQAIKFTSSKYLSYVLSPLVPVIIIAVIVACMSLYGLFAMIPIFGDIVLYGLGLPLIIFGGIVMTILLLGLFGYPMMYTTISTEGSDTFDGISRAYNYVFQAPWQYLWYWLVALVYGAAVTFVVIVVGCLMVYLGKFAVGLPASAMLEDRKPDFLFVYAPESLGWKELLLKGSPVEIEAQGQNLSTGQFVYGPVNEAAATQYNTDMTWWNKAGAGMSAFWMVLVFLMMIGFSYSYFWSASTMIYLLMRKKIDEIEIDEVYIEEEPAAPVMPEPVTEASAPGVTSLPTVPPTAPTVVPPVVPPPPPVAPPIVPPPPVVPPAPEPEEPTASDEPKPDEPKPEL